MKSRLYKCVSITVVAVALSGNATLAQAGTLLVEATGVIVDDRPDAEFKYGEPIWMRFAIDTSVEGQPLDMSSVGDPAPWLQFVPALESFEVRIAERHYSGSSSAFVDLFNDAPLIPGYCYDRWVLTMTPDEPRVMPSGQELFFVQIDLIDYQSCDLMTGDDLSELPVLVNATYPTGRFAMFNDETAFVVTSLRVIPEPPSSYLVTSAAALLLGFKRFNRGRRNY